MSEKFVYRSVPHARVAAQDINFQMVPPQARLFYEFRFLFSLDGDRESLLKS